MSVVEQMFTALAGAPAQVLPSRFWEHYNRLNLAQLETGGYDNFKRTIVHNYFTSVPNRRGDYQLRYLHRHLPPHVIAQSLARTALTQRHTNLSWKQSRTFTYLTYLVWEFAQRADQTGMLAQLEEPEEGNPPRIYRAGRRISQDVANATLEWNGMRDGGVRPEALRTVMELGAGYGRTAWLLLQAMPGVRYIIVDIPPALYLAQRYLSGRFRDRRIFTFRPFTTYDEVRDELERAEIAFLLPHQMALLPDKSAQLFVNISSLHEMRPEQIAYYLGEIDRLTDGHFYMKQWKVSRNDHDGVVIRHTDYPIPPHWQRRYIRTCRIHTPFFEAVWATRMPRG